MGYTEIIGDFIGMLPGKNRMWKSLWGLTVLFDMIYKCRLFHIELLVCRRVTVFGKKWDWLFSPSIGEFSSSNPHSLQDQTVDLRDGNGIESVYSFVKLT